MKREIVDALIASLNDPDAGWEYSEYAAINDRIKCRIWLGGGPGLMRVTFSGPKIFDEKNAITAGFTLRFNANGTLIFHKEWARRLYATARLHQVAKGPRARDFHDKTIAAIRAASEVPA